MKSFYPQISQITQIYKRVEAAVVWFVDVDWYLWGAMFAIGNAVEYGGVPIVLPMILIALMIIREHGRGLQCGLEKGYAMGFVDGQCKEGLETLRLLRDARGKRVELN